MSYLDLEDAEDIGAQELQKLTKDLKDAAKLASRKEARYLVDLYYQIQERRIQSALQVRAMESEPTALLGWVGSNMKVFENRIKSALGSFASEYRVGRWLQSICGIGPVISAGLLSYLDVRGRPHGGHFCSYAGMCPGKEWKKGEVRPWNADLKVLCWKAGESFIKVQNRPKDFYGKLYAARRAKEEEMNLNGKFEQTAKEILEKKKFGKDTEAYKAYSEGKLPPAHLLARARRYAIKIFLSHVHYVMYNDFYGKVPLDPYAIAQLDLDEDHRHFIAPPNWPMEKDEGKPLSELFKGVPETVKKRPSI